MNDLTPPVAEFHSHGISFQYPDFWEVEDSSDDNDLVLTVSASETSFWVLRLLADCPSPPKVIDSCVDALKSEYDDFEAEETDRTLIGLPAVAKEASFICMDTLTSVEMISTRGVGYTVLVYQQSTNRELEEFRTGFQLMTNSLVFNERTA